MIRSVLLALAGLCALSACVAPSRSAPPQFAALPGAGPGAMLSAAPGEVVYTELESTFAWTLTLEAPVRAGSYRVEAGDYPLQAVALNGFLFEPGDGCEGDPSTRAGRLAAEAASIFVPADADRVCVINIFDVQRCTDAKPRMGHAPDDDAAPTRYTLVYEGLEPADPDALPLEPGASVEPDAATDPDTGADMDGAPDTRALARFELITEQGELVNREALISPAPGLLEVGAGRFKLVSADETGVVVQFEEPISGRDPAEPPRFREPRAPVEDDADQAQSRDSDAETGEDADPIKIRTAPDTPQSALRDAALPVGPR